MSDTSQDEPDRGRGTDGTIPDEPGTVGVGAGEPTTFEPEEDPEAAATRAAAACRPPAGPRPVLPALATSRSRHLGTTVRAACG